MRVTKKILGVDLADATHEKALWKKTILDPDNVLMRHLYWQIWPLREGGCSAHQKRELHTRGRSRRRPREGARGHDGARITPAERAHHALADAVEPPGPDAQGAPLVHLEQSTGQLSERLRMKTLHDAVKVQGKNISQW